MSMIEEGHNVKVHYKGTLTDATEFDNSKMRGEPIEFRVGAGQMIKGFDSAVKGMGLGEVKTFTVPSGEAYGSVNPEAIKTDLEHSWEVLAEAVQTVMRKLGIPEPYEQLKALTRGRRLSAEVYQDILIELNLPVRAIEQLRDLTPAAYIGDASALTRRPLT